MRLERVTGGKDACEPRKNAESMRRRSKNSAAVSRLLGILLEIGFSDQDA
jgi:hypothetical protein